MQKYSLEIVEHGDHDQFLEVEFSKAELKRLYNVIYRECERHEKEGYEVLTIKQLKRKLKYFIYD